jgi:hypothetical protein
MAKRWRRVELVFFALRRGHLKLRRDLLTNHPGRRRSKVARRLASEPALKFPLQEKLDLDLLLNMQLVSLEPVGDCLKPNR